MKITVKTVKPRNPHALAARQRKAGKHDGDEPQRRLRRAEKLRVQKLLAGRLRPEEE